MRRAVVDVHGVVREKEQVLTTAKRGLIPAALLVVNLGLYLDVVRRPRFATFRVKFHPKLAVHFACFLVISITGVNEG